MKIILSIILSLALTNIYAQSVLKDHVKDSNTNEAIVYASIYLP